MKRLILCFDGTWMGRASYRNYARFPTNVEKTSIAISKRDNKGIEQITLYFRGIGTDYFSHILGGMTGMGINLTICDAYAFIVDNFNIGQDELYFFGFSRGAYTARSLSGFMEWIGVVKKENLHKLPDYYDQYKLPEARRDPTMQGERLQEIKEGDQSIPIHFLGVWDTVGALGVPFKLINGMFAKQIGFHNAELSKNVSHAYHALAIHEHRKIFSPTLWSNMQRGQDIEQVWFSGTHSDVGGGNPQTGLSNITLCWMIERAENLGLAFDTNYINKNFIPNCMDEIYNSSTGWWRYARKQVRTFGQSLFEYRHTSVDNRYGDRGLLIPIQDNIPKWQQAINNAFNALTKDC